MSSDSKPVTADDAEDPIETCQSLVKEAVWMADELGAEPTDIADALEAHASAVRDGLDSPGGWELKGANDE